jgi:hypothetical protein
VRGPGYSARRALGEQSGAEQRVGARVRKSRQKEAAGAADAVLMQIEWSEGEVLKSAGVGTEAEVEVVEGVGRGIDGGKRWDRGGKVGIMSGAGRTGASGPCGAPMRQSTWSGTGSSGVMRARGETGWEILPTGTSMGGRVGLPIRGTRSPIRLRMPPY